MATDEMLQVAMCSKTSGGKYCAVEMDMFEESSEEDAPPSAEQLDVGLPACG